MRNSAAIFFRQLIAIACLPFLAQATSVDVDLQSSTDGSNWSSTAAGLVASDGSPVYYRATMTPAGGSETVTNVILVDRPAGSPAHVRLESGDDLSAWSMVLPGNYDITGSKQFVRVKEDDSSSEFVLVQGGTLTISGVDVTVSDFQIARFEVTQELWDDVYNWALGTTEYDFSNNAGGNWNAAGCVNGAHPVNNLNWYDAVKWCNARSEKEGLTPVYYTDSGLDLLDTYRSGELAPNLLFIKSDANGYRLLTRDEWPYAGRGGQLSQNHIYSGSDTAVEVARHAVNSSGSECPIYGDFGTWSVGSLLPNELGIYDMSGNVNEWIWDGPNNTNRYNPGGTFFTSVDQEFLLAITYSLSNTAVQAAVDLIGFRLARNAPAPEAAQSGDSTPTSVVGKGKRQDLSQAKPGKLK